MKYYDACPYPRNPFDLACMVPGWLGRRPNGSLVAVGVRHAAVDVIYRYDFPSTQTLEEARTAIVHVLNREGCDTAILLSYVDPHITDPSSVMNNIAFHLGHWNIDTRWHLTVHEAQLWVHDPDDGTLNLDQPKRIPAISARTEEYFAALCDTSPKPKSATALELFHRPVDPDARADLLEAIIALWNNPLEVDELRAAARFWMRQPGLPEEADDLAILTMVVAQRDSWDQVCMDIVHSPTKGAWDLWINLAQYLGGRDAAGCLFLAGLAAYCEGYTLIAQHALDSTLQISPSMQRAHYVREALRQGAPPETLTEAFSA